MPRPLPKHFAGRGGGAFPAVLASLVLLGLLALWQVFVVMRTLAPGAPADTAHAHVGTYEGLGPLPEFLPPLQPTDHADDEVSADDPVSPEPSQRPDELQTAVDPSEGPAPADPAALEDEKLRELVNQAIDLRRRGDMPNAIARLQTALSLEPAHPRVLFEQALTYETMGLAERAASRFEAVAELGPERAGVLYEVARRRLDEGLRTLRDLAPIEEAVFIGDIREMSPPQASQGETRRVLAIDLHARPGHPLDNNQLTVVVQFFNLVDGHTIEPISGPSPRHDWVSQPVDWTDPGIETLEVTYIESPADRIGLANGGRREYFGYLVEVYYQDVLVDAVARPRRLSRFRDDLIPGSPARATDLLFGGDVGLPDFLDDEFDDPAPLPLPRRESEPDPLDFDIPADAPIVDEHGNLPLQIEPLPPIQN